MLLSYALGFAGFVFANWHYDYTRLFIISGPL